MRIIKISILSLIALLVLFLSIGTIFPSFDYTNEVKVEAPMDKCWQSLNNPTTMHRWMQGLETYKLISGEHLQPGGTYSLIIVEGSERMEMIQKIEDINPPASIHLILTNDVLTSDFSYLLSETDGVTTLQAHYEVTGNSILWSSVLRLSKGYISGEGQKQLQKLKTLIESEK